MLVKKRSNYTVSLIMRDKSHGHQLNVWRICLHVSKNPRIRNKCVFKRFWNERASKLWKKRRLKKCQTFTQYFFLSFDNSNDLQDLFTRIISQRKTLAWDLPSLRANMFQINCSTWNFVYLLSCCKIPREWIGKI